MFHLIYSFSFIWYFLFCFIGWCSEGVHFWGGATGFTNNFFFFFVCYVRWFLNTVRRWLKDSRFKERKGKTVRWASVWKVCPQNMKLRCDITKDWTKIKRISCCFFYIHIFFFLLYWIMLCLSWKLNSLYAFFREDFFCSLNFKKSD